MNERTAILTDRKSGGAAVLHILNEFYIFPVYVVQVFVGSQSPLGTSMFQGRVVWLPFLSCPFWVSNSSRKFLQKTFF